MGVLYASVVCEVPCLRCHHGLPIRCGTSSPLFCPNADGSTRHIHWAAIAPRVTDRIVFDKLIQVLVFGCGYRKIADERCSATTIRTRRDEWIAAGLFEAIELIVLECYDRIIGLQLSDLPADGCSTKAPAGGQCSGPSPLIHAIVTLRRLIRQAWTLYRWDNRPKKRP